MEGIKISYMLLCTPETTNWLYPMQGHNATGWVVQSKIKLSINFESCQRKFLVNIYSWIRVDRLCNTRVKLWHILLIERTKVVHFSLLFFRVKKETAAPPATEESWHQLLASLHLNRAMLDLTVN